MDVLEHKAIKNVIICSTVLEEVFLPYKYFYAPYMTFLVSSFFVHWLTSVLQHFAVSSIYLPLYFDSMTLSVIVTGKTSKYISIQCTSKFDFWRKSSILCV